jgi:fumarate hydratase class II
MRSLERSLRAKEKEFSGIIKTGRTHLQDAVPMRLGSEFGAYAGAVSRCMESLRLSMDRLLEVPIGGTAVGTGINAGKAYTDNVTRELSRELGVRIRRDRREFTAMSFRLDQLGLANSLDECAIAFTKTANDLRLLASGPRAGLNEILLPAVMPGSSIMPGKVNPSVAEMLNMVCYEVMGNVHSIRSAVAGAQLELNVFTPVISYKLISSIGMLANAVRIFDVHCVRGIKANKAAIQEHLGMDLELATALNQYIGYAKAAEVEKAAMKEGKSIKQVCLERNILDEKTLDRILDPVRESGMA